jgi:HEAT repeat protein
LTGQRTINQIQTQTKCEFCNLFPKLCNAFYPELNHIYIEIEFKFQLQNKMMYEQKQSGISAQSLVKLLENEDGKVRTKARKSLVTIGKQAISPLSLVLENSKIYKARWEAAKALGEIGDLKSIPTLVKALEDPESDVAWLAAKALEKFRKAAWPELLRALVERGADSTLLQHGAHHILRKQKMEDYNDLLEILRTSLETGSAPESISPAAYNILERMKKHSASI